MYIGFSRGFSFALLSKESMLKVSCIASCMLEPTAIFINTPWLPTENSKTLFFRRSAIS